MLADIQEIGGNLFLGAAACVAVWLYLLNKLNKGGEAKKIAGGWVIRSLRNLLK
jgi:hypothetical protein